MNELICDAIARREILVFRYLGKERIVQPHFYGWNKQSKKNSERIPDFRSH